MGAPDRAGLRVADRGVQGAARQHGVRPQCGQRLGALHRHLGGEERTAGGTGALPPNAWSHHAATYDGAALRLYVNAALVRTTSYAGSIATSASPLRIGGNSVWPEWFKGLIDDVRVYGKALTASEIQNDRSRGV
jgi:hypothetical protein